MKSNVEMNSSPAKSRSLPHVWKRFWHLNLKDRFYIGKELVFKTGLFTACPARGVWWNPEMGLRAGAPRKLVAPWRRVRTTQLVRDARPQKLLSAGDRERLGIPSTPYTSEQLEERSIQEDCGKTHFVGDDCPGGHRELIDPVHEAKSNIANAISSGQMPRVMDLLATSGQPLPVGMGTVMDRPRVEQPNSDNSVSGPTS